MIFKRPLIMGNGKKYSTYITEYKKNKYKRLPIDLSIEEFTILTDYCRLKGISKTQFVRNSVYDIIEEYYILKKSE